MIAQSEWDQDSIDTKISYVFDSKELESNTYDIHFVDKIYNFNVLLEIMQINQDFRSLLCEICQNNFHTSKHKLTNQ